MSFPRAAQWALTGAGAVAAMIVALALPAAAHVTVNPGTAELGGYGAFDVTKGTLPKPITLAKATPQAAPAAKTSGDSGTATTLGVLGLIAGLLGLVAGILALIRSVRSTSA
jgi:hypothetical protein